MPDTLDFDHPKSIILQGDYDYFFSLPGSTSIIYGSITISDGTIKLAGIIIE